MTGLSIEKILKDPSVLKQYNLDREYKWMGAVSKEEAQRTLRNIKEWSEKTYEIPKNPYKPKRAVLHPVPPRNISPLRPTPYEMEYTSTNPVAGEDEGSLKDASDPLRQMLLRGAGERHMSFPSALSREEP